MLLNVPTTVEHARRGGQVRARAGRRGRDRWRGIRRAAAVVAAVALNAALGVEPAGAQHHSFMLLVTDARVTEGDSMTFSVSIPPHGSVEGGFKVTPTLTDGSTQHSRYGTATEGTDYTANTPTLTFEGESSETHTFTIDTIADSVAEAIEVFTVGLSVSGTTAGFSTDTSTGYIVDDPNDKATVIITGPASADEGDAIEFTVTLDKAVQDGFTVTPSFTDGTATSGTDYTANTAGIVFTGSAGETKTLTVPTTRDQAAEGDETFTVSLAVSGTSASVTATGTATGTILNVPALSITLTDGPATEGDPMTFTVALDAEVSEAFQVDLSFTDVTATDGTDYTADTASLSFAGSPGETKTFTVATTADTDVEGDETFTVGLAVTGTSEAVTATDTATGTILNDDAALTIAGAGAGEGDGITFTVTLDNTVQGGFTVTPSFTDETATSGTDYAENTAGIRFAGTAGESQTFTVATTEDQVVEGDETFTVNLPVPGRSAEVTATGTIRDDDSAPEVNLSVNPSSGSEGASHATVTVTAAFSTSNTFPEDETVTVSVGGGTATAGTDYAAVSDFDITIPKGATIGEATFTLRPIQDKEVEGNETIDVAGRARDLTVNGTELRLTDDDGAPEVNLSVSPSSVREGASRTTVTVTAEFSTGNTFPEDETVTVSVGGGTATAGTDYAAVSDFDITIPKGATSGTARFTLRPTQDKEVEGNETIDVAGRARDLTVNGAELTLTDDDDAPDVNLSVNPSSVNEGASGTTVTVTAAFSTGSTFPEDETVTVSVGGGTATAGTDYAAVANFDITIAKGATSGTATFTLRPTQDKEVEGNETIDVAGRARDLTVKGTELTLTDNGAPDVNLSVSPSSVNEGAAGTTVTVTAAFSTGSTFPEDETVTVSVRGGTATAGMDYAAVSNFDITIPKHTTTATATFTLRPTQDTAVEGSETIDVAGRARDLTVKGTELTLTDDDGAPEVNLSVSPSSVSEGASDTTVTVTAAFSTGSTFPEDKTLTVSVGGGTATSGTDYAAVSNFDITIPKHTTSATATFTLRPTPDTAVEGNETVAVAGSAGDLTVNGTELTLTDDDGAPEVNLSVSPSSVREEDESTTVTVTAAFSSGSTFGEDTTVRVSVGGGTATAGTDYAAVPGLDVTIPKGQTSGTATFTLTPTADAEVETAETIRVTGGAPGLTVNGTRLTLVDSTPRLGVRAARAVEGETMEFTVTLRSASSRAVTVQYATVDGTATAGADYTSTSGQLVFSANETERRVRVPVADDDEVEDNETFTLAVQLANAARSAASATGTILENDVVTVSVTAPDVRENDGLATFAGSLSSASSYRIVVEYATSDGTATAGADYLETTGELVFAPGETEKAVAVQVLDDDLVEGVETLVLSMRVVPRPFDSSVGRTPPIHFAGSGAAGNGEPASLQITGMIRDDDLARTRGAGTSRTLYLLARSMASEAVAAIGERFVVTGGDDDTPRAALDAGPRSPGHGVALAGTGAAYPAAVSSTGGAGATPLHGPGATAMHRASDEPFADLGWLRNAQFSVPVGDANQSGRWQVWGRAGTVRSRLQTRTGGHARGDVFASHVGVDRRLGDSALLGVSLSHTVGLLGYTVPNPLSEGASPGEADGRVTSVQPYAHWAPREGLTLWGMGGGGLGSLTLADSVGMAETSLGLRLFAGGARQALTTGLALKADAFHATLRSAEHPDLAAATGTAMRGRMLAEGQTDWALSESSSLIPRLEAGVRWDGGTDVEGLGAEVGVGFAYVNRRLNLGLETQGRYLVAHQADGFEEWGAGLSLRVGPGVDRPGPWLALHPEWGASGSRVQALWDPRAAPELHRGGGGAPGARPDRIGATAGYRLSEANSVSVGVLQETRPGAGRAVAARVTGNLNWGGGTGGELLAPADLRFPRGESGAAGEGRPAARQVPVRLDAVAVAPFLNLSGAPVDHWIGDRATETLTRAFEQLDAISLVGRGDTGAAAPAWLVTGDYQRRGDRLQFDARVVDTRSGAVAVRSRAEGVAAELFELQDRIAANLARELRNLSAGDRALARRPVGSPATGIVEARASTPARLDAVDAALPSPLPSPARRAVNKRDAGIVEARASARVRLDTVEARSSAPVRLDTVAIERFHNLSRGPADDWLGAGVAETLTTAFQQLDAVKVAGNTEAAWLVTGEYRRQGDWLQIDAVVVDARSGAVAARAGAEGAAADFFDLQDRITADLAGALENLSTGREAGHRELEAPERPQRRLARAGLQDARMTADASRNAGERVESVSERSRHLEQVGERLLTSGSREPAGRAGLPVGVAATLYSDYAR